MTWENIEFMKWLVMQLIWSWSKIRYRREKVLVKLSWNNYYITFIRTSVYLMSIISKRYVQICVQDAQLFLPVLTVRFQASRIHTQWLLPLCILPHPAIRLCNLPNSVKWNVHVL
jgi:hypothetical protein